MNSKPQRKIFIPMKPDNVRKIIERTKRRLIIESLKMSAAYVQHYFYEAIDGIDTHAHIYIHPLDTEYTLKKCAISGTIPTPAIKKMVAYETLSEHFGG